MSPSTFTPRHRAIGITASFAAFFLEVVYAVTLILGLLSLASPQDPIGDPYFTIMEVLIILMVPFMVESMVVVQAYASREVRIYGFIAVVFMILMAGITSGVHFMILTVSRPIAAAGFDGAPLFFSFRWPSVVYALDILAWDWFFALAMLCAAPVFRGGGLERWLRMLMISSGILSLAGLIGVPLGNMQVRNIGIGGYAVVAPAVFLLLSIIFKRTRQAPGGEFIPAGPEE
jgi:hypothetical protein